MSITTTTRHSRAQLRESTQQQPAPLQLPPSLRWLRPQSRRAQVRFHPSRLRRTVQRRFLLQHRLTHLKAEPRLECSQPSICSESQLSWRAFGANIFFLTNKPSNLKIAMHLAEKYLHHFDQRITPAHYENTNTPFLVVFLLFLTSGHI